MAVRKYLFWKGQEGIKTYKVVAKGKFELLRPYGKEYFPGKTGISLLSGLKRMRQLLMMRILIFVLFLKQYLFHILVLNILL